MALLSHFSHKHPLVFEDEEKFDADDVKHKFCSICGLLMFTNNPSYSCTVENCNFSLHQQCAELPQVLDNVSFDTTLHDLILREYPTLAKYSRCAKCGQTCKNFMYGVRNSVKDFRNYLHPFCALPIEIKTKHRSHSHHPLTPTQREICALCDACGEKETGLFMSCQPCDYWIHLDCALLPPIAMHHSHSHPLILLYYYPFLVPFEKYSWGFCKICVQNMPIENGIYFCDACSYGAHLKCIKSSIKHLTPQESRQLISYLPPAEEDTIFPSLIIRSANLEQEEFNALSTGTVTKRITPEECHNHPLIFHGSEDDHLGISSDDVDEILEVAVCNACIQPISPPYYSCNVPQCHFLVHELCANLRSTIWGKLLDRSIYIVTKWRGFFYIFDCAICLRKCNGFGYSFDLNKEEIITLVDVECASAPRIIKHESHKNHFLHLIRLESYRRLNFSCCSYFGNFYACITCDFKIHTKCALLPKNVRHKFDKHPLLLITNAIDHFEIENYYFCEFCEKGIDLKFWFYYCSECDQSFHVNCIPSVGEYSKIKFGGTLDDVPCHPYHPLTSVRMLTVGSHRCGYCKKIVQGFEDDIAFQCSTCDFWIHFHCAYYSRGCR